MGLWSRAFGTERTLTQGEYQTKLLEEQNSLLRELLVAIGRQPSTLKAKSGQPIRSFTAKDVVRVTRADRLKMQAEAQQAQAPWRTPTPAAGPGSETTSTASGSKSDGRSPGDDPMAFAPTPDGPL